VKQCCITFKKFLDLDYDLENFQFHDEKVAIKVYAESLCMILKHFCDITIEETLYAGIFDPLKSYCRYKLLDETSDKNMDFDSYIFNLCGKNTVISIMNDQHIKMHSDLLTLFTYILKLVDLTELYKMGFKQRHFHFLLIIFAGCYQLLYVR
jgi:hypothetical protein